MSEHKGIITPLSLLLLFVVISLLVSLIPSPVTFTEYSGSTLTIYFKNTDNITVIKDGAVTVWKGGIATVYSSGFMTTFDNFAFSASVFAYDYGLHYAAVPRTGTTFTLHVKAGNYIEGFFPNVVIFTAYSTDRTLYFYNSSITLTIVRR